MKPFTPIVWYFILASLVSIAILLVASHAVYRVLRTDGFVHERKTLWDVLLSVWASVAAEVDGFDEIFQRGLAGSRNTVYFRR